jgi:hypothetical protein
MWLGDWLSKSELCSRMYPWQVFFFPLGERGASEGFGDLSLSFFVCVSSSAVVSLIKFSQRISGQPHF